MRINPETELKIDRLIEKMTVSEKVGQLHQIGPSPVGGFEISRQDAEAMYKTGKITAETYNAIINHTLMDKREDEIRKGKVGSFIGVDDLEKANALQKIAVEESRLGIPMIMGMDVIHGHKTIFPVPLAQACCFDEKTFEVSSSVAAGEAREDGIHWTYAPMSDIARDARWGRTAEGFGEDTLLASRCAAAAVSGFQGDDLSDGKHIAACAKHFAAYGACEGGRDYDTVDMSIPKFYEVYLPPFKAAVDAGAATVMAAFNDLNGVPCTVNKWLLKEVLRKQLGFNGFVISDAHAIEECVEHGIAQDIFDAVKQAITAGCDMDLGSDAYTGYLERAVTDGEVDMKDLDASVRAVLRVKFALGLFDAPYTPVKKASSKLSEAHRKCALEIARKSAVLLKNNNNLLPFSRGLKIAVVGAAAADRDEMHGTWCCSSESGTAVSLIDALKSRGINLTYNPCVSENEPLNRAELYETIENSDAVIACLLYHGAGEADSRTDLGISEPQREMLLLLKQAGKPVAAVLFNGRPLALGNVIDMPDAFLEAWHLGSEAGNAIADILFGDYNPTGRLAVTLPHNSAEYPIYYNHPNTGRPAKEDVKWCSKYADSPVKPLFPFGFGLSYTEFRYSELTCKADNDILTVSVTVTNAGERAGEETVQTYVHRKAADRVRPVKELKEYTKVWLDAGESKTVSVRLTHESLGYYNTKAEYVTDESLFRIWMGHDSASDEYIEVLF